MPEYRRAYWVAREDYDRAGPFNWHPVLLVDGHPHVLDMYFANIEACEDFITKNILTARWAGE